MIERSKGEFNYGYNSVTELDGKNANMLMDFGILKLKKEDSYTNEDNKERAFLLIEGSITYEWEGQKQVATRKSSFDESPFCLHVPGSVKVTITGEDESLVAIQAVYNDTEFSSVFYTQEMCRSEQFGAGTLGETSTRTVRTIFDDNNAPYSEMVIGEVITHPGKWSSYPPHHHPQPEVYYYRFNIESGFGYCEQGDDIYKVHHNDAACIEGGKTHPQTAAPGYAMYYLWLIPHLKEARFNDRIFVEPHKWTLDPKAKIWPDKE